MGDIGEPVRTIEFEPLPEEGAPVEAPAPDAQPEREPVPA